jgi:hypothetical protein
MIIIAKRKGGNEESEVVSGKMMARFHQRLDKRLRDNGNLSSSVSRPPSSTLSFSDIGGLAKSTNNRVPCGSLPTLHRLFQLFYNSFSVLIKNPENLEVFAIGLAKCSCCSHPPNNRKIPHAFPRDAPSLSRAHEAVGEAAMGWQGDKPQKSTK